MDNFAECQNWVITNVGGVPIEFGVGDLNSILGTLGDGLKLYTSRKALVFSSQTYVDVVRNICGCVDSTDNISNIHLCAYCLCL